MNDVETARSMNLPSQAKGMVDGRGVLDCICLRSFRLLRQIVAMDMDAIDELVFLLAAGSSRADDRDFIAMGVERGSFLPDSPIEWRRQILHQNQYTASSLTSRCHRTHSPYGNP